MKEKAKRLCVFCGQHLLPEGNDSASRQAASLALCGRCCRYLGVRSRWRKDLESEDVAGMVVVSDIEAAVLSLEEQAGQLRVFAEDVPADEATRLIAQDILDRLRRIESLVAAVGSRIERRKKR